MTDYAHQYDDQGKKPWIIDMEKETLDNDNFRTTLWTGEYLQLTVMSIPVGGDIGLEVHENHDQFLRIEQGTGTCYQGDAKDNLDFERPVGPDMAIFVPAGKWHNVVNTGTEPLKLYTLYALPDHVPGTVHPTQADAQADENE